MSYYEVTLENGIKIKSCKMKNTHSVTIILLLKGGAAWEPLAQKGITHLIEHLCFRRCNGIEQKEFYYKIEKTGGYLRGFTSRDSVLFEITVHPKFFGEAAQIISSLFYENDWKSEDIKKEKAVVCREIANRSSWAFHQLMYEFFEHKSPGDFIAGTPAKIMRLNKAQLVKWKRNLFCTNNSNVTLAGNINDENIQMAKELFSKVPKSNVHPLTDIMPKSFLKRKSVNDKYFTEDANYLTIALSFDIDYKKVRKIQGEILENIFCRGLYAPFKLRLREDLGLIYEIDSDVLFYDFGGQLYFIFEVQKDKSVLLMEEITEILFKEKQCLDKKAFECVKNALTFSREDLIVSSKDFSYLMNEEIRTPQDYIKKNMSITYEEVQQGAREILKPENMTVVFCDVAHEEELLANLHERKEILRERLGE